MNTLKVLLIALSLSVGFLEFNSYVSAQSMMSWPSSPSGAINSDQTAAEEAEGKIVWDKLQAKQRECRNLTDDDFDVLGEYFMGQSLGNTERHTTMNLMMKNMLGEKGETQMHVATGKRFSGCDSPASSTQNGLGFMSPMFWMMGGGGNSMMGYGNFGNMMNGWASFGILGWASMLIFWLLLILGVIALLRYLSGSIQKGGQSTSSLDIIKERYAKGEIDKKEYEEKKKDLNY